MRHDKRGLIWRRQCGVSIPLQGHRPMRQATACSSRLTRRTSQSLFRDTGRCDATGVPPTGIPPTVSIPLQGHRPMRRSVWMPVGGDRTLVSIPLQGHRPMRPGIGYSTRGASAASQSLFRDTGRCDDSNADPGSAALGESQSLFRDTGRCDTLGVLFNAEAAAESQSLFRDTGRCDSRAPRSRRRDFGSQSLFRDTGRCDTNV